MEEINITYITNYFNKTYKLQEDETNIKAELMKVLANEYYIFFNNSDVFKGDIKIYKETNFYIFIDNILKSKFTDYTLSKEDIENNNKIKVNTKEKISQFNERTYINLEPSFKSILTLKKDPIKKEEIKQNLDIKISKKQVLNKENNEKIMDFYSILRHIKKQCQ